MKYLTYLFWPNPGVASYAHPALLLLLIFCISLIAAGMTLRWLRVRMDTVTRKLTRSWPIFCIVFGATWCAFVISRVEGVQYLSMRFLWVIWIAALAFIIFLQWKLYRTQHYRIERVSRENSARDKYLPSSSHNRHPS